jgi:hypothetical protein
MLFKPSFTMLLLTIYSLFYLFACSETRQLLTTETKLVIPSDQSVGLNVIDISLVQALDQAQSSPLDQSMSSQQLDQHVNQPLPNQMDAMLNDQSIQGRCQSHCDCMNGYGCVQGQCTVNVPQAYCCGRMPCPQGESCQYLDGREGACGLSQGGCRSACDCPSGQQCQQGACVLGDQLLYCCSKTGIDCPNHQRCENEALEPGICVSELECQSACHCLDGFACIDGRCVLGDQIVVCCLKDNCITGLACQRLDGTMSICE